MALIIYSPMTIIPTTVTKYESHKTPEICTTIENEKTLNNKQATFEKVVQSAWNTKPSNITKKLLQCMSRRLDAVIAAKGLYTKY